VSSLASGEDMEKDNSIQKCCGGFCQHIAQDVHINEILHSLKLIRNALCLKNSEKHESALTKRFFTKLNAGIQFCAASPDKKSINNNEKTKLETHQEQNEVQLKHSPSVAIDMAMEGPFYNQPQGEKSC